MGIEPTGATLPCPPDQLLTNCDGPACDFRETARRTSTAARIALTAFQTAHGARPVDVYRNLHVSPSTAESKRANVYNSSLSAPPSRMRYPPAIVMFGVTS